jgi:hypothetical protein
LKIAGRVAFFTISSDYQPPPPKLQHIQPDASVACLVPGTIFSGYHHEPFRARAFLTSKRPVALQISEVWQVAPGTFKYPGAAVIGHKRATVAKLKTKPIAGCFARQTGLEEADFSVRKIGTVRTAWVLEKEGLPIAHGGMTEMPQQGADLMPRTAVCIEILSAKGSERRVDTPRPGSPWSFTVKAAKELKNARFPGHIAPRFIYHIAQSENLLPFMLGNHSAPIAIPADRNNNGVWQIHDETGIRQSGFTETARRFRSINGRLKKVGQGKSLQQRINERGKLSKQVFGKHGHLIIAGAGGKHICAACLPLHDARDLIIDQTLYWKVIPSENEAWFCVGMLNSHAMTEAIMPFNPKGSFGERHIHSLPYRLMPAFDPSNEDHLKIAQLAKQAAALAHAIVAADDYLNDPNRALTRRRSKLRKILLETEPVRSLEVLCAAVLGTTVFGEDPQESSPDEDDDS